MIERLTWWALEQALGELRAWQEEDLCPSVAVNLSPRCLQAPDMIERVRDLLIGSDLAPSALTLEITESLLMSDPELAEELLNQLGLMGVRVAIDDFGTGYSSLSRLKRLPVDTIKIDREFVINMDSDRDDEAIVKATLELARTLGCAVVAEGVETFETWHRLQALGCQQIQGYILAQPMPAQECRQWLRSRRNLLSGKLPSP
jgi:EAL domain-containing protein (putative c-di-GMP-specific phosphodiesterase class I)